MSFSDHTLKEGMGLVYIERYLGPISEFCRTNHDNHVIPCYSCMCVRAIDALPSKTMHCHVNRMICCILCTPEIARCITDLFTPWGWCLGMRLLYEGWSKSETDHGQTKGQWSSGHYHSQKLSVWVVSQASPFTRKKDLVNFALRFCEHYAMIFLVC